MATPEATSSPATNRQILRAKTQHGLARLNGVSLEGCHKQQGLLHIQSHFDTGTYIIIIIIIIIIRVHHVQKYTRAILPHAALCHS